MTWSIKTEHYYLCNGRMYGYAAVLDCIRFYMCKEIAGGQVHDYIFKKIMKHRLHNIDKYLHLPEQMTYSTKKMMCLFSK